MLNSYETIRNLYIRTANEKAVINAYKMRVISASEYKKILGEDAPGNPFDDMKAEKIALSKALLSDYLDTHPLNSNCHGGIYADYTVTEEKQNMFSRKFSAHMALVQAGIPDKMTWNAAGRPCEEWTDAECIQFIAETNAYVTPLVSYQQHLEVAISSCATENELNEIEIDYGSLITTYIPVGDEVAQ